MRSNRFSICLRATLAICTVTVLMTSTWAATEKRLHNFGNGTDGVWPYDSLIFDADGNLYGTTEYGGDYTCADTPPYGCGTVFELSPTEGGGWTEKRLHNFGAGTDGLYPETGLIFDADGNLYGTTSFGGDYTCSGQGCGTVFEMSPNGSGGWTEKKLHNFGNGTDGNTPVAGLVSDADGNLYGTTSYGGDHNSGTVFELTREEGGGWTEKKLHNFGGGTDGSSPSGGLIFDADGNLYGTTHSGGGYSRGGQTCGTVFELAREEGGGWTEKKLHNFGNGMDGYWPSTTLIFDAAGNLYGTTSFGGDYNGGTVFKLSPNGSGGWTEKVLHNFGSGMDGVNPNGRLIFDADGNLYGTTYSGGDFSCFGQGCGTVFEMSPDGSGGWTEKKLYSFGVGVDGISPRAGLIFDADGNLYSTTQNGGVYSCGGPGCGTVFEITP